MGESGVPLSLKRKEASWSALPRDDRWWRCENGLWCEDSSKRLGLLGVIGSKTISSGSLLMNNSWAFGCHSKTKSFLLDDMFVLVEHIWCVLFVRQRRWRGRRRWRGSWWWALAVHLPPAMFSASDFRRKPFRKFWKDILESRAEAQHEVLTQSRRKKNKDGFVPKSG